VRHAPTINEGLLHRGEEGNAIAMVVLILCEHKKISRQKKCAYVPEVVTLYLPGCVVCAVLVCPETACAYQTILKHGACAAKLFCLPAHTAHWHCRSFEAERTRPPCPIVHLLDARTTTHYYGANDEDSSGKKVSRSLSSWTLRVIKGVGNVVVHCSWDKSEERRVRERERRSEERASSGESKILRNRFEVSTHRSHATHADTRRHLAFSTISLRLLLIDSRAFLLCNSSIGTYSNQSLTTRQQLVSVDSLFHNGDVKVSTQRLA
jgi:hypothetical protein